MRDGYGIRARGSRDLLSGDRDARRPGDGVGLALERRFDQVNVCRKMYRFVTEGRAGLRHPHERQPLDQPVGHVAAARSTSTPVTASRRRPSVYQAARIVGDACGGCPRSTAASLERDNFSFNVNLLLGGQVARRAAGLYLSIRRATRCRPPRTRPYLQLGEVQVRPADPRPRHRRRPRRSKSRRSTRCCRSTRPCDRTSPSARPSICCSTGSDASRSTRYRRLGASDPDLNLIHASWEQSLRRAVEQLPEIEFEEEPQPEPVRP